MIYLDLPWWLWALVALYFAVSVVDGALSVYRRWLENRGYKQWIESLAHRQAEDGDG